MYNPSVYMPFLAGSMLMTFSKIFSTFPPSRRSFNEDGKIRFRRLFARSFGRPQGSPLQIYPRGHGPPYDWIPAFAGMTFFGDSPYPHSIEGGCTIVLLGKKIKKFISFPWLELSFFAGKKIGHFRMRDASSCKV